MSTIFCSTCGKKILRSQLSEHIATEHPKPGSSKSSSATTADPISEMAKVLLSQLEENKRLMQTQAKRKRPQVVMQGEIEMERFAKKQKQQRYDYNDFCVDHINPGECFVKSCKILRDYIVQTSSPNFTFCGKHDALYECFQMDCSTLRLWFLAQLGKKEEDDPLVSKYLNYLLSRFIYCSIFKLSNYLII